MRESKGREEHQIQIRNEAKEDAMLILMNLRNELVGYANKFGEIVSQEFKSTSGRIRFTAYPDGQFILGPGKSDEEEEREWRELVGYPSLCN